MVIPPRTDRHRTPYAVPFVVARLHTVIDDGGSNTGQRGRDVSEYRRVNGVQVEAAH